MGLRNSSILCIALFLAFSSSIQGLDIVKTLSKYPEFAKFTQYLVETKLADQINGLKAVTVFAVLDSNLASLAGQSQDVIKAVIGGNIIPDYYDEKMLILSQPLHEKLPTLVGSGMYVGLIDEGVFAFSSGEKGNQYNSILNGKIVNEPSSVSVLQVSQPFTAIPAGGSNAVTRSAAAATTAAATTTPAPTSDAEKKPEAVGGGAPAPAPSSGSRAVVMGLVGGAVMALASLFISL